MYKDSVFERSSLPPDGKETMTGQPVSAHNRPVHGNKDQSTEKTAVQKIADPAGIQINGSNPWDPQIHHSDFYSRFLAGGSLALGESYMDGWWDCPRLDQFFEKIFEYQVDQKVKVPAWVLMKAKLINAQTRSKAYIVGERHYDIGNDIFSIMLDRQMNYSCGYWKNANTLDEAQDEKLALICNKMQLKKGMRVLDIGCGWGSLAKYAAQHYGVSVLGITISKQQESYAASSCRDLPVQIELKDYRQLEGEFDRIISVGMFEHVGYKNYRSYFKTVRQLMKPEGLFLLHTIGGDTSVTVTDPWINKYIFPNSMLPSAKQITQAAEGLLVMEDWHNFGHYYDPTLMAWYDNFTKNWDRLTHKYDDRFYRMWTYYLLSCAAGFRARRRHLWQIVFSKNGLKEDTQYLRDA